MRLILALMLLCHADTGDSPSLSDTLSKAALEGTKRKIRYDGRYMKLKYPGGDVPADMGVCTDVIVRSFRAGEIDLQKLVHEDMEGNFSEYPRKWGEKRPDTNIDHRRVPNLMKFFERKQTALPITDKPEDYLAGDVVAWDLGNGTLHIGLVVAQKGAFSPNRLVVHNIGRGDTAEDVLFQWKIIGHYRYHR